MLHLRTEWQKKDLVETKEFISTIYRTIPQNLIMMIAHYCLCFASRHHKPLCIYSYYLDSIIYDNTYSCMTLCYDYYYYHHKLKLIIYSFCIYTENQLHLWTSAWPARLNLSESLVILNATCSHAVIYQGALIIDYNYQLFSSIYYYVIFHQLLN